MYRVFRLDPEKKNQKTKEQWAENYPDDEMPDELMEKQCFAIVNDEKEVLYTSPTGESGTWKNAWGARQLDDPKGCYADITAHEGRLLDDKEFHRELF